MYDYFDVQRLSYLTFDWPWEHDLQIGRAARISPDGVGFQPPKAMVPWYSDRYQAEETIDGRALRAYLRSMKVHLSEARRVLRPNGVIACAVANSMRGGQQFNLVGALSELMREAGFKHVRAYSRIEAKRRILPLGRNPKTGRFSSKRSTVSVDERIIYAVRSR